MTLSDAVRTLGTTATIAGVSNAALVRTVRTQQDKLVRATPGLPSKGVLTEALGLHGPLRLRPISAMLELARGTALQHDPELAAVARRWAVLRYLGLFARDSITETLSLDPTALQFVGANQRRVISEELGIGFGIVAAKKWCRTRNPNVGPITAIDVDRALYSGTVPGLHTNGERQPDYLLSYPDSSDPARSVFELLETKGTVSPANAKGQLGRAVTQLAGLTIDGRAMTGVATSTVSNEAGFTVMSVDPEEAPVTWKPSSEKLEPRGPVRERSKDEVLRLDVAADELFAAALNVDKAALAEYSGLHDAAKRWLPTLGDRGATRGNSDVSRETSLGEFVGTELVIDVPGTFQRLRVFQGVERFVAEELKGLDAGAVAGAQQAIFSRMELEDSESSHEAGYESAIAFSSDGAMLEVSVA